MRFSPTISATFPPPVMEARRWIDGVTFPTDRPLLNLSQAAPVDPPPAPLLEEMSRVAREDVGAHLYGPVLGLPELRDEIATQWSAAYSGTITADQVAITSGCNQAFCAAISAIAGPGDEIILPTPFYFNHVMHLTMAGLGIKYLPCGADMVPDPENARDMVGPKTRAIVLITPNNPTGAEYPKEVIAGFAKVARQAGIALIIDETYRDFHASDDRPHDLFMDPDWSSTVIQLYSFSKAYRLTGHRVGAMIAGEDVLAEVEKYLDTVSICPNQIGQRAALYGLRHLGDWVATERREILARRAAMVTASDGNRPARLLSVGAYFGYFDHGLKMRSDALAKALVKEASLLLLPGTMFAPTNTDGMAERTLRVAFANADSAGIAEFANRFNSALDRLS